MTYNRSFDTDAQRRSFASLRSFPPVAGQLRVRAHMDDLSRMSDAELATWQAGWKERTHNDILAGREWQRRMVSHELQEQFKLEERLAQANQAHTAALAKAAQDHAERLSANTRWWSLAAAVVGVLGTLAGAWLSKPEPTSPAAVNVQQTAPTASSAASQAGAR